MREVVERCMQASSVLDKKGNPVTVENAEGNLVPAYTFEPGGANRALELLGKEFGMFIERRMEVEDPLEGFQPQELREFYNAIVALQRAQAVGTDSPASAGCRPGA